MPGISVKNVFYQNISSDIGIVLKNSFSLALPHFHGHSITFVIFSRIDYVDKDIQYTFKNTGVSASYY